MRLKFNATMKKLFTFIGLVALISCSTAQQPYNPEADAQQDIKTAVANASENNHHVLLIIGGNWCPWCIKLNKYIKEEAEVAKALANDYEVVKVNYSKENKNK